MEMTSNPIRNSLAEVSFRKAVHADARDVADILTEAAKWIAGKGIRQWPVDGFSAEGILGSMMDGQWILAEVHGQAVGVMVLHFKPQPFDEAIWGPLARDDRAVYLHRLAVRRARAGQGLGQALLHHAMAITSAVHKPLLRLDCRAHNEALNRYYSSLGFRYCGEHAGNHAGSADRFSLFEIAVQEANGSHE